MGYKPYAKYHLYETAHSGFYDGELSAEKVNLLPKTWTKYTVTDGDWKTEKTLEPLWNRDIFLANEIDKVEEDKRNHYIASSHFVIDHENETMYVNPFDSLYEFDNGILYDGTNYNITTNIPSKQGGIINKLYLDNGYVNYACKVIPEEERYVEIWDQDEASISSAPHADFSATINGSKDMRTKYNELMANVNFIAVFKDELYIGDDISSGEWQDSSASYWDKTTSTRKTGPIPGHCDRGTSKWENTAYYHILPPDPPTATAFFPTDRTQTQFVDEKLTAGYNYISGDIDMIPQNTLYIW
jgi:hypothetical protein